jgi:hypothetical protein
MNTDSTNSACLEQAVSPQASSGRAHSASSGQAGSPQAVVATELITTGSAAREQRTNALKLRRHFLYPYSQNSLDFRGLLSVYARRRQS